MRWFLLLCSFLWIFFSLGALLIPSPRPCQNETPLKLDRAPKSLNRLSKPWSTSAAGTRVSESSERRLKKSDFSKNLLPTSNVNLFVESWLSRFSCVATWNMDDWRWNSTFKQPLFGPLPETFRHFAIGFLEVTKSHDSQAKRSFLSAFRAAFYTRETTQIGRLFPCFDVLFGVSAVLALCLRHCSALLWLPLRGFSTNDMPQACSLMSGNSADAKTKNLGDQSCLLATNDHWVNEMIPLKEFICSPWDMSLWETVRHLQSVLSHLPPQHWPSRKTG